MSGQTLFAIYNKATGKVLRSIRSPFKPTTPDNNQDVLTGYFVDNASQYIDVTASPMTPIDRPDNTATIDTESITAAASPDDEATITSIPNPSTVRIFGPVSVADEEVTDTQVEFSTDTAGTYTIIVMSFPEKDVEFTVTAT